MTDHEKSQAASLSELPPVASRGMGASRDLAPTTGDAQQRPATGLAPLLAELRSGAGLSLQAVANRAGLTKAHVWELEVGRSTNPGVETLVGLARALETSPTSLFAAAIKRHP